jgi:Dak1 domain
MKKLMNEPQAFVDEMLEGLLLAYPDRLKSAGGTNRALVRADAPVADKVGIVTGGGSGHLPVFLGYVGRGRQHSSLKKREGKNRVRCQERSIPRTTSDPVLQSGECCFGEEMLRIWRNHSGRPLSSAAHY